MRFLIDAHDVGGRQTGNETWIRNVSRELAPMAAPDELVFAAAVAGWDEVEQLTGAPPMLVGDGAFRRLVRDLPGAARKTHADAHLVQYTMPLDRRPAVVMIHDLSADHASADAWLGRRSAARIRLSTRTSARRAAHLLAPSEFTRRGLITGYGVPADRISVSPNAVDPALDAALRDQTRPDRVGGQLRVLTVGNVVPRKNLGVIGTAVNRLRAEGLDARLRVVGTVRESGRQTAATLKQTLGDAVSISGYVDTTQLATAYLSSDVLCFPSLFEGFGIPALEAMAAGTPVVASDSTSLPEVVGEAGVLAPPDDPAAWEQALRSLAENPDRADALAQRGRERARMFSWHSAAAAVLAALRGAVQ